MHVLLVTPEAAPLVVFSERAHDISGMTRALCGQGVDVTVVAPALHNALHQRHALARRIEPIRFELDGTIVEVALLEGRIPGCNARVILLDHNSFGAIATTDLGTDDATPYATFARAALQVSRDLGLGVDLIHAHDWQCGLVPLLAHRLTTADEIRYLPVVYGAHSTDLPGHFHPDAITQASWFDEQNDQLWEMDGPSSLLYTGTVFADAVTTDNAASANLLAERLSHSGLPEWIAERLTRQPPISPIAPGLDYERWNSATSRHTPVKYSADRMGPKALCKHDLLDRIGLPPRPNTPLVGVFCSKGAEELLRDCMVDLASTGVQVALIGDTNFIPTAELQQAMRASPNSLATWPCELDERTVQRALAGSDALLIPAAAMQPVALVLKAFAFGTVPLVHAGGGVREIVVDFDPPTATGTALLRRNDGAKAIRETLDRLYAIYQSEPHWRALQRTAMSQRYDWPRAAEQQREVYRLLLAESPSEAAAHG
jgi:starch synthase